MASFGLFSSAAAHYDSEDDLAEKALKVFTVYWFAKEFFLRELQVFRECAVHKYLVHSSLLIEDTFLFGNSVAATMYSTNEILFNKRQIPNMEYPNFLETINEGRINRSSFIYIEM